MNFDRRMMISAALAITVTGCTATDAGFGNAVRQSFAAQVIDPDPQYEDADHATDGTKAASAVKRYRTDAVKKPDTIRTTSAGTPE